MVVKEPELAHVGTRTHGAERLIDGRTSAVAGRARAQHVLMPCRASGRSMMSEVMGEGREAKLLWLREDSQSCGRLRLSVCWHTRAASRTRKPYLKLRSTSRVLILQCMVAIPLVRSPSCEAQTASLRELSHMSIKHRLLLFSF